MNNIREPNFCTYTIRNLYNNVGQFSLSLHSKELQYQPPRIQALFSDANQSRACTHKRYNASCLLIAARGLDAYGIYMSGR